MAAHVLVADDDPTILSAHQRILSRQGYATVTATDGLEALEALGREPIDAVVTDLSMPGLDGLQLLERMREQGIEIPVVVVSGQGTIEAALQAVRLGATDFLEKPITPARLLLTLENALRHDRLLREHTALQAATGGSHGLVGSSAAMERLRELIGMVAPSEGRVLILGENGTGKELVAEAIHDGSPRRGAPFVKLNCAAVPSELIESELFGHERGAFTGATSARKGRFELADGGTLLLDEIGDMPASMQAKLLRVLQEGRLERVGGSRTIEVDVRILAATNRDLAQLIGSGTFREDLYYRINVVSVPVPALRERLEDVPALAEHFLASAPLTSGRRPSHFEEDALRALMRHDFPGNVRELRNLVERFAILSGGAEVVTRAAVEAQLPELRSSAGQDPGRLYRVGFPLRELMREAEQRIVAEALEANDGNKSATARSLGVERSHFFKKLKQLEIGD